MANGLFGVAAKSGGGRGLFSVVGNSGRNNLDLETIARQAGI